MQDGAVVAINKDIQVHELKENGSDVIPMYQNASMLKITEEEQKELQKPVPEEDIEIRPDGLIYYPQVFVRDKLNQVLGIGQWALIQHSCTKDPKSNKLFFDGSLYIRGTFVARAVGEQEYHDSNPMQSWASAYEGAKSDCLVRCCKDIGIGKELWQPKYSREWVKKHAVKVFIKAKDRKTNKEEIKTAWRRKDQEPYWNETGIVPDNNKKDNQPQQEAKQEPKKEVENLTAKYESLFKGKSPDEIKKAYNDLPAKEKGKNTPAYKLAMFWKENYEKNNTEKGNDKLDPLVTKMIEHINSVKEIPKDLEAQLKAIDEVIDEMKPGLKNVHLEFYKQKLEEFHIEHEPDVIPF